MGNNTKKQGSKRTVVDKGPILKQSFGGASNAVPRESVPRSLPRKGRHIWPDGHYKYGRTKP